MNQREREQLAEVLAQLYDTEQQVREFVGDYPPAGVEARQTIERLVDDADDRIEIDDSVTLLGGRDGTT